MENFEVSNLRLSVMILKSYASNNQVPINDLSQLIHDTHAALENLTPHKKAETKPQKPAVPIKESITPDFLICLEDGEKLVMLKRHLRTKYNLSPEEYRIRWNLPPDYPVVAPNYSKRRSSIAKATSFGRKTRRKKT